MTLRNLLTYRLVIVNFSGAAVMFWAWQQGYIATLFGGDESRISYIIAALFLFGLFSTFIRATKISRGLNAVKSGRIAFINGPKLAEKNAHLDSIASYLVTLGLLGTVIGFAIALAGVDQNGLASASGIQAVATQLMAGMKTAIFTTIVGAVFGLWTEINTRILKTATVSLIEDAR